MWLFTTRGMYSAVQHRDHPEVLLVRSRSRADLINLAELATSIGRQLAEPEAMRVADYPWRIQMTKGTWADLLEALTIELDYANFKTAVGKTNAKRAWTYHDVWDVLHEIEREPGADTRRPPPHLPFKRYGAPLIDERLFGDLELADLAPRDEPKKKATGKGRKSKRKAKGG